MLPNTYNAYTQKNTHICIYAHTSIYCYIVYIHIYTLRQFVCYSLCVFLCRCNWHTTFTVVTPRSQLHPVPHLRASIGAEKNVGVIDLGKSLGGQEELRRWRFGTFVFKVGYIEKNTQHFIGGGDPKFGVIFVYKSNLKEKWRSATKVSGNTWEWDLWNLGMSFLFIICPTKDLVWQGVKGLETWRPSKGCQRGGSWGAINSATLLES